MGEPIYVTSGTSSGATAHMSSYDSETGALLGRQTGGRIDGVGGAIDPDSGDIFSCNFGQQCVIRFPPDLASMAVYVEDTGGLDGDNCESLVFRDGKMYVGHADGNRRITQWDVSTVTPVFERAITVPTGPRGTDHMSLHPDGETMYYTCEGGAVNRYNIRTDTALAAFASPGGTLYGVTVSQNSEQVFVVGNGSVYHYAADGTLIRTMALGVGTLFACGLSLDETILYTGAFGGNQIFKIEVETGAGAAAPFITQNVTGCSGIFSLGGSVSRGGWTVGYIGV